MISTPPEAPRGGPRSNDHNMLDSTSRATVDYGCWLERSDSGLGDFQNRYSSESVAWPYFATSFDRRKPGARSIGMVGLLYRIGDNSPQAL